MLTQASALSTFTITVSRYYADEAVAIASGTYLTGGGQKPAHASAASQDKHQSPATGANTLQDAYDSENEDVLNVIRLMSDWEQTRGHFIDVAGIELSTSQDQK